VRLRSALRALFPPVSRSRLALRGGWIAFPLFLVLNLFYPLSLEQSEWVGTSDHLTWVAIAAVLLGTLVGNGRLSTRRSSVLGAALGTAFVLLLTILVTSGAPFRDRATALAIAVNNWVTQVIAGEAASDPTVFVLCLGATTWAASYMGAFALARMHRIWDALLLSGFCLVVNVSLALTNLLFDLVAFSLVALVLMTRLHIVTLQERWERQNIVPAGEMDWRVLRGGLTWTAVLIIMALVTPRVGAAEVVNNAFNAFEAPYHRVEAEWQRFFAGVSGPSRLRGVSFSDAVRLGLSPNLGDRVVMTVESPSGHFWRAVTYDFYTGAGWRTTETDRSDRVAPAAAGRERFDATFAIEVPHASILFGANEPVRASVPHQFQTGADRTYSTALRAVNRQQAAGSYTVTSLVSTADKALLRRAATNYPAYIKQKYLQLPSSVPQRVRDLGRRLTEARTNPYDKAEAIETYLRTTYRYSTVVRTPPAGRDPVDYFLFDLKEDFCEYFASSMAVMLRDLGIPARVVEGFTSGTYDPELGRYVVRELNAHAWVEVYVPQYGWIEFEPTPSETVFPRGDADFVLEGGIETESPLPPGLDELAGEREGLGRAELDEGASGGVVGGAAAFVRSLDPRPALAALGLVLLLALLAFARFELRFRGLGAIDRAWGKTRLLGAYVGHAPHDSQTAYEYAESLGRVVPDARIPLHTIAHARVLDRYAAAGASDDDRDVVEAAWHRAARALLAVLPQRLVRGLTRFVR